MDQERGQEKALIVKRETIFMKNESGKAGSITRLFGVILVFLGALDSMLAWRGGFALNAFYIALIASGIFLYAIGAVRRGSRA